MTETLDAPETPAPASGPTPARNRWATAVWLVSCVLVVVFVVGAWMRLQDERSGTNLGARIADGKRPAAPALPTRQIDDDGAPGLPDWYRATGTTQANADGARVMVVNFWASWCAPCVDEAPILREVAADYEGRVVFVGLNPGNEDIESDARAFVREHRLTFPIVRGDAGDRDAWGVRSFPETFVVGTDGRVSVRIAGPVEEDELRALLDDELGRSRT